MQLCGKAGTRKTRSVARTVSFFSAWCSAFAKCSFALFGFVRLRLVSGVLQSYNAKMPPSELEPRLKDYTQRSPSLCCITTPLSLCWPAGFQVVGRQYGTQSYDEGLTRITKNYTWRTQKRTVHRERILSAVFFKFCERFHRIAVIHCPIQQVHSHVFRLVTCKPKSANSWQDRREVFLCFVLQIISLTVAMLHRRSTWSEPVPQNREVILHCAYSFTNNCGFSASQIVTPTKLALCSCRSLDDIAGRLSSEPGARKQNGLNLRSSCNGFADSMFHVIRRMSCCVLDRTMWICNSASRTSGSFHFSCHRSRFHVILWPLSSILCILYRWATAGKWFCMNTNNERKTIQSKPSAAALYLFFASCSYYFPVVQLWE